LPGFIFATLGALTGKLIDDNNNPLTGADVFLVNQNMHDSTDAAGAFSFSGMSVRRTGALAQRHFLSPQLSDNVIYFTLGKSGIVEYDIYSVKGVCVYRYRNTLDQGDHFLSIAKNSSWLAGGIYVISFRTEDWSRPSSTILSAETTLKESLRRARSKRAQGACFAQGQGRASDD